LTPDIRWGIPELLYIKAVEIKPRVQPADQKYALKLLTGIRENLFLEV